MRPSDVRFIISFNTRMGMFVCPSNRENVVAFLDGYEWGTENLCKFTKRLSEHIAKKHRIKPGSLGWPHQIAQLAEKRSLHWMEVYLLVSSEVLSGAVASTDKKVRG
jgi:hypothetical protein